MKFKFPFGASAVELENAASEEQAREEASRQFWCRKFGDPELDEIVEAHRVWVESGGESGAKADLIEANFEEADLIGAQLRGANLLRANLHKADMLLADLRGACLIEADMREANVVGANFRGASLLCANLSSVTGLVARQLAGASLFGASVPESLYPFEGLTKARTAVKILHAMWAAIVALCILATVMVFMTTDAQIISGARILAIPVARAIPAPAFYLIMPMLLAGAYIAFHFFLQHLWDALGELPAVFPDGRRLSDCVSPLLLALAPDCLHETREGGALYFLRRMGAKGLACALIPATITLLWMRYLTAQDLRGSLLQIFLLMLLASMSGFLPGKDDSIFAPAPLQKSGRFFAAWRPRALGFAALGCCLLLIFVSVGAIFGMPHGRGRPPGASPMNARCWAADLFWLGGYDPFPKITLENISVPPAGWSGADADIRQVRGAHLENASLRYAQAYRAFFVNARMENADLRGGYFVQADFRGANLLRANLSGAALDRTNLAGADLTYALLEGAQLKLATLNGADLYDARLDNAVMPSAQLVKTDLREALLENASLENANLKAAYLSSADLQHANLRNATLQAAFLDAADLRGADLRGAIFNGTIVSGANLQGVNLDGADLRGALNLTPEQVCSAASRANAQFQPAIEAQVARLCGTAQ